jgi:hypothetical protein
MKIKEAIAKMHVRYEQIVDCTIRQNFTTFFNIVEFLNTRDVAKDKLIQSLKDENNKLKGEQGKPNIRPQKNNANHSSDKDRKSREKSKKPQPRRKKKDYITMDRTVLCSLDKSKLPPDAQNKGYAYTQFQDLKIAKDNVEFKREKYYSPSLHETFIADLPAGYKGEFGPTLKATTVGLYHASNMTGPALSDFFETFGIYIGTGSISRFLTDNHKIFHKEKEDIVDAGLQGAYQHTDDTMGRVNGINHHVHILSNPLYTAYFTRPKKDRLTLLEIFCRGELKYTLNQEALKLMTDMGLSQKWLHLLASKNIEGTLTRSEIDDILIELFPNKKKQKTNRRYILEASALVYYHNSEIGRASCRERV